MNDLTLKYVALIEWSGKEPFHEILYSQSIILSQLFNWYFLTIYPCLRQLILTGIGHCDRLQPDLIYLSQCPLL